MRDYIEKCECSIHSLKQGGRNVLAEATIVRRLGTGDYLADYNGVRCHATSIPFVCRYYVDDRYGVVRESAGREQGR
jgi:hypothetical protein